MVKYRAVSAKLSSTIAAPLRAACLAAAVLFLISSFAGLTAAQPPAPGDAPPPPRKMSDDERRQLDGEKSAGSRTKLALKLMDIRLGQAERLAADGNFNDMFKELGAFQAIVADTLKFLKKGNPNSNKILNNFKRLEIGVRRLAPRVEVLRRDLPQKYDFYVRRLAFYLRDVRAEAIEPLFDETVVPGNKP